MSDTEETKVEKTEQPAPVVNKNKKYRRDKRNTIHLKY